MGRPVRPSVLRSSISTTKGTNITGFTSTIEVRTRSPSITTCERLFSRLTELQLGGTNKVETIHSAHTLTPMNRINTVEKLGGIPMVLILNGNNTNIIPLRSCDRFNGFRKVSNNALSLRFSDTT